MSVASKPVKLKSRKSKRSDAFVTNKRAIAKTRRAKFRIKKGQENTPARVNIRQRDQRILELRIAGYSEYDIGVAEGIHQSTVSQSLTRILTEKAKLTEEQAPILRELELERIDRMTLAWYKRAKIDPRASDTLLKWIERKHKIQGLDIGKLEFTGANGGPIKISASSIDITKLNDTQLLWLEEIIRVAGPEVPIDGELPKDKKSVIEHNPKKRRSAKDDYEEKEQDED